MTYTDLKKNLKKDYSNFPHYTLKVIGDCATQHICNSLRGYAFTQKLDLDVSDTDYNQLDAQILDTQSSLYSSLFDYILIIMCTEKLYEAFTQKNIESRKTFAVSIIEKIEQYWKIISERMPQTKILQFNFPERDDAIFGNYANKITHSFLYQIRKLNLLLMEKSIEYKNVSVIDISTVQNNRGIKDFCDTKLYYIAKMPFALDTLPYIAKCMICSIQALIGKSKKCLIFDLDNTVWGGVIGDDGINGIQIGDLGTGYAFSAVQLWIKELKNRGIILAVCSKNNEEIAKEPFLKHPDMILRLDDIAVFVANWEDKASNIRYIQKALNIGFDSMVFIDDNPFERNLVRQFLPEITVPELPEDPALYMDFLKAENLFETASYSEEDGTRTEQYQTEFRRIEEQKKFAVYEDYLQDLNMKAVSEPFTEFYFPRIAQLSQRSNQFNLRTIRYTENQIKDIAYSKNYFTLYFTLEDKFGDHGLISAVILTKEDDCLFIDTWFMSCRVLKRGMERFIMNQIVETAQKNGYESIKAEYIPTEKNAMVEKIYSEFGFTETTKNMYSLEIQNYNMKPTYITKIKGDKNGTP